MSINKLWWSNFTRGHCTFTPSFNWVITLQFYLKLGPCTSTCVNYVITFPSKIIFSGYKLYLYYHFSSSRSKFISLFINFISWIGFWNKNKGWTRPRISQLNYQLTQNQRMFYQCNSVNWVRRIPSQWWMDNNKVHSSVTNELHSKVWLLSSSDDIISMTIDVFYIV